MEPKIFWVRLYGQGPIWIKLSPYNQALNLMGDWCSRGFTDTIPEK